ncbi:enoyl-CoA hydratase/isomerase family protein [Leucobacter soli]|uniref:Short-chain-enoyl-CoA hydratase n=1 Tax=Leucobacter soli TaxID=2812850 RepID=A0A916NV69_9MICO|nr:enoyl-CoA hydratase/isomerase family protein [Leucobacter soli]CAG7603589.1 Short-chain-enoyl-CoA hydratase [Leucobacter soli]
MSGSAPLRVQRHDDYVLAALNSPEKRNAIDQELIDALHSLCAELEEQPRTLVLCGAEGFFASGADIAQLRERRAADALKGINLRAFQRINELPMPVIAVVSGYALGGGAELAYAADIRIGTPTLKVGNPETGLGIIAGAGAGWRLRELVGEPLAAEILLAGRVLGAEESLRAGLITHLEENFEAALARAEKIAGRIASLDPAATQASKRVLRAPRAAHPQIDLDEQSVLFESPEKTRRMTEFLEKKKSR